MFQAEECIDKFEYDLAQKFCQRALELDADNADALETTGTLLLELGNPEGAKHVSQFIGLKKNSHQKYLIVNLLHQFLRMFIYKIIPL